MQLQESVIGWHDLRQNVGSGRMMVELYPQELKEQTQQHRSGGLKQNTRLLRLLCCSKTQRYEIQQNVMTVSVYVYQVQLLQRWYLQGCCCYWDHFLLLLHFLLSLERYGST